MTENPPLFLSERDRQQLKLLEIFHYVMGGLAVGGMAFIFVHYMIMSTAFSHPWPQQPGQQQPPFDPAEFFRAFRWFYAFMGAWGLLSLVANLASAFCLHARRYRMFSMIVAGFNCINFPFGTPLGICTLIVLTRSTIPALYQESRAQA